jgi:hypothetical protein
MVDLMSLGPSRIERGDMPTLLSFLNQWRELRPNFAITIVQPGYSKSGAVPSHLELLAATESFLMDTWRIPLQVWTSA